MVELGGFDVMVLTKMKISTMAYFQNRIGYEVTCLAVQPSSAGVAQGGIQLVKRERPVWWGIESTLYHGPNLLR